MIQFTVESESIVAKFRAIPGKLTSNLSDAMDRIGSGLMEYIIANKLSGQVLDIRSGKLISSENYIVSSDGSVITATVSAGGSDAPYAPVQEYGGTFEIPSHLSMSRLGREYVVRAHSATFQERSFQRSGLYDYTDIAMAEINDAVANALSDLS